MEIWLLTEEGRRHILEAEMKKSELEEKIIVSLTGSNVNTVEEIAHRTGLDINSVEITLKRMNEKHWVWKKTTKFTPF